LLVGVHPHTVEIVPKTWLHESARRRVERLAGRTQNVMHDGGHEDGLGVIDRSALQCHFLLLAFRAVTARGARSTP
jgi:hypothetical protein